MTVKRALLSAAAVLGLLLAGGCKSYATQGNARQVGQGANPVADDPAYRSSSGVHGDQNTLAGRTGTFNASGHRGATPKR